MVCNVTRIRPHVTSRSCGRLQLYFTRLTHTNTLIHLGHILPALLYLLPRFPVFVLVYVILGPELFREQLTCNKQVKLEMHGNRYCGFYSGSTRFESRPGSDDPDTCFAAFRQNDSILRRPQALSSLSF